MSVSVDFYGIGLYFTGCVLIWGWSDTPKQKFLSKTIHYMFS